MMSSPLPDRSLSRPAPAQPDRQQMLARLNEAEADLSCRTQGVFSGS